MPVVPGTLSQLLTRDYHDVYFDSYDRYEDEYSKVARVMSHDEHQYKEGRMGTFGGMVATHSGGALPMDDPIQGDEKEIEFTIYRLGFTVTQEAYDDDRFGHLKKLPDELGRSAAYTRDLIYFNLFNNATDTDIAGCIDGKPLLDSDHTIADGSQTIDNATTGSFSKTTFEAALEYFEGGMYNERGIPMWIKPKILLIPYQQQWVAKELFLSKLDPTTADNAENVFSKDKTGIKYVIGHHLTSSSAWFLLGDPVGPPSGHDVRFIWREKTYFQSGDDLNTRSAIFGAGFRAAVAAFDYRGVFGSTG